MKTYLDYKNQIEGFEDVSETVKAMEKISASSVHFLKQKVANLNTYASEIESVMAELSLFYQNKNSPLLQENTSGKKTLIILSGERGLVGGLWHNLIGAFLETGGHYQSIIVAGAKGENYLKEEGARIEKKFANPADGPEISMVEEITDYIFSEFKNKAGRYAVIYKTKNSMIIFNDPAGYRQIFYYKDRNDRFWCFSQPSLLLEKFDLNFSQEIKRDMYSTPLFEKSNEYWFPGKVTLYENVFHLTANHYIDLKTFEIIRYWPKEKLAETDIDSGIRYCSKILEGIMTSAMHRFKKVAFGITSGLDTRILLSVSNSVAKQIHFFTHTHAGLDDSGSDIIIPKKILSDLNLDHNIFYHKDSINQSFESIFYKNVTAARIPKLFNADTIYRYTKNSNDDLLVVNGNCSEITRNFFRLFQFFKLDAKTLCVLSSMSKSKVAYKEFSKWLSDIKYAADLGFNLLDLFYWENRNGNWSAMSYSEYDIAFESLSPLDRKSVV